MDRPEEVVRWLLENKRETPRIEVKRSIELIKVSPQKIEEEVVAIANSAQPESYGWMIFGIDESFDIVGMVDLKLEQKLDGKLIEIRKQEFSQLAERVNPPLDYEWCYVSYDSETLVAIRIKSRRPGHWFRTSKGGVFYRLDDDTYVADDRQIRKWIGEPLEETEEELKQERVQHASIAYLTLLIASASGFTGWVLAQQIIPGIVLGLGSTAGIIGLLGYFRSWPKTEEVTEWCRKHSFKFFFGTASVVSASLAFTASLCVYPLLSGITLDTYLIDLPRISMAFFVFAVVATTILYIPTASKPNGRTLVHILSKLARKLLFLCLIFVVVFASLPLDTLLLICVPKISFTESCYIVDDQIHLEGSDMYLAGSGELKNLEAYVSSEETMHFLFPLTPLTRSFFVSFGSNSSRKPLIVESPGLNCSLLLDNDRRLYAIKVLVLESAGQGSYMKLKYYSDLNISSVLRVYRSEKFLKSLGNNTSQYQLVINFTNVSQHNIYFHKSVWLCRPQSYFEVNGTYVSIDSSIYLPSGTQINRSGSVEITVVYNR